MLPLSITDAVSCVFVCKDCVAVLPLSITVAVSCVFVCRSKEDLVVCAPFYHAPGVSGALYVYYNSGTVCSSFSMIN